MVTLYPRRGKSGSTPPAGEADRVPGHERASLTEPETSKKDAEG
jgi:hypothetical protein